MGSCVDEFFELITHLGEPYRTMVLIAQCLRLRVSEILGLNGAISISRIARF
jgi:hypothetical protein